MKKIKISKNKGGEEKVKSVNKALSLNVNKQEVKPIRIGLITVL